MLKGRTDASEQIYTIDGGNSLCITCYFRYFKEVVIVSLIGTNYRIHFLI